MSCNPMCFFRRIRLNRNNTQQSVGNQRNRTWRKNQKQNLSKVVAAQRKMSLNKLYEEISSSLLRGHSAEMRFRKRAAEGNRKKGLAILDQLDKHFVSNQK